ncbi:hypothetical protein F4679DRAFT_164114 [Xylaria curta]|nr:hypothetical protein F4679DRAFT_164114 [Xylaria curta]
MSLVSFTRYSCISALWKILSISLSSPPLAAILAGSMKIVYTYLRMNVCHFRYICSRVCHKRKRRCYHPGLFRYENHYWPIVLNNNRLGPPNSRLNYPLPEVDNELYKGVTKDNQFLLLAGLC